MVNYTLKGTFKQNILDKQKLYFHVSTANMLMYYALEFYHH